MKPQELPHEVWEALCRRCGKCCTEKVEIDGKIYLSKKYCRFLDLKTKQCTVYEDRFVAEPDCSSVADGLKVGIFPSDCPYVKDIKDYDAPIESWDDQAITDTIRDLLGDDAV